jgi:hypothetical protein
MGYFKATLDELKDEKVVMITHHTPTSKSTHPKFAGDPGNAYFNNHLENWILEKLVSVRYFVIHLVILKNQVDSIKTL